MNGLSVWDGKLVRIGLAASNGNSLGSGGSRRHLALPVKGNA